MKKTKNTRSKKSISNESKVKLLVKARTRLEMVLLVLLLIVTAALYPTSSGPEPISLQNANQTVNVDPSKETVVPKVDIAAKLDYSRQIITVQPGKTAAFKAELAKLGGAVLDEIAPGTFVVNLVKSNHEEQLKSLQNSGTVKGSEVDYPIAVSADTPDWGVDRINAPQVWPKASGSGVKIAILDTGIAAHPDLSGRVLTGYNFVADNSDFTDFHGHGTHVAGIATAVQNGEGIIGASYGSTLLVAKVLSDDGTGYLSDVIEGVNWARQNGARVINMSLGTTYNSGLLESAINQAVASGIVVVAAAGNTSGGALLYPAAYGSVLSVGATDKNNLLASFSSVGANVVAPGVGITSTLPGGRYSSWSGTSMASPHVAGAAALLISQGQTDVRKKLMDSATDLGAPGTDSYYGYGLINANIAINNIDQTAPLVTIISPLNSSSVKGGVHFRAKATDESGLEKVTFTLDGKDIGQFTVEPFQINMPANKIGDGEHTLIVTAIDKKANTGEAQSVFKIEGNGKPVKASPTPTPTFGMPDQNGIPTQTNINERNQQSQPAKANLKKKQSIINRFFDILTFWS